MPTSSLYARATGGRHFSSPPMTPHLVNSRRAGAAIGPSRGPCTNQARAALVPSLSPPHPLEPSASPLDTPAMHEAGPCCSGTLSLRPSAGPPAPRAVHEPAGGPCCSPSHPGGAVEEEVHPPGGCMCAVPTTPAEAGRRVVRCLPPPPDHYPRYPPVEVSAHGEGLQGA